MFLNIHFNKKEKKILQQEVMADTKKAYYET